MPDLPVTIADVTAAAERLAGHVAPTPLLESPRLNAALGGRLLIKPECLQKTGSFKFRGAYNGLCLLAPETREKGVLAYSSGNHAQGVALAAAMFGVSATIIMPHDAPEIKKRNTRAYGAELVIYQRGGESREEIGERLCAEKGLTLIKPFDQESTIAGQGSTGLEIVRDCVALGLTPDLMICPAGGGGLITGLSLAVKAHFPDCAIHPAEPAGFDDWRRSLAGDRRLANDPAPGSICDAILTPTPGEMTFAIGRETLSDGFAVSDAAVLRAMKTAFTELKLVVEPGGCVALAALLSGAVNLNGRAAVCMLSGGNVDPALFQRALSAADDRDGDLL